MGNGDVVEDTGSTTTVGLGTGSSFDGSTSGGAAGTSGSEDTGQAPGSSGAVDTSSGDGSAPACGDAALDPGEDCDDGNVDELDGCTSECTPGPTGVSLGPIQDVEGQVGGWVSASFDETWDCGPDEALRGIRGGFGYYFQYFVLAQVRGVCAPLSLVNAVPTSVEIGGDVESPTYGVESVTDAFDLTCPPGELMSSLGGAAGLYADMLTVSCRAVATTPDGLDMSITPGADLPPFGMIQPVEDELVCPDGTVAAGLRVMGDSYAARFELRCRSLGVTTP